MGRRRAQRQAHPLVPARPRPTCRPPATRERYPGTFSDGSVVRPPGSDEPRQVEYKEGLQVGYRWYAAQGIEPLFPFGHGLTYTTFAYDKLEVTPTVQRAKDLRIRFRVTNTGTRTGTETAQAYVELPASAGEPSKRLLGWQKVTLAPGQSRTVQITHRRGRPGRPAPAAVLGHRTEPVDHAPGHVRGQRRHVVRHRARGPVHRPLTTAGRRPRVIGAAGSQANCGITSVAKRCMGSWSYATRGT